MLLNKNGLSIQGVCQMAVYKFKKEDTIECVMTTMYEVEAPSLAKAKSLLDKAKQVGLMFTDADILTEGKIEYVKK